MQVDALQADKEFAKVHKLLEDQHKKSQRRQAQTRGSGTNKKEEAELLWRLARSCLDISTEKPTVKDWRKNAILQGLAFAEEALDADEENCTCSPQLNFTIHYLIDAFHPVATHKWFATLLSAALEFKGKDSKIKESVRIKEHALKALELHPQGGDATTHYLLGRWHFAIAGITWLERFPYQCYT